MTGGEDVSVAVAFAGGLFCLFMPVRWLGVNPYTRKQNAGFDEAKAREHMWIVRLMGVALLAFGGAILAIVLA